MAEALVAGTGLQVLGNLEANAAQAEAERENAAFLEEQAIFSAEATAREKRIFQSQGDELLAEQISAFNKSGVELSGSALVSLLETDALIAEELFAIEKAGRLRTKEALFKSVSARKQAALLEDPVLNALQATGTILSGTAPLTAGSNVSFGNFGMRFNEFLERTRREKIRGQVREKGSDFGRQPAADRRRRRA